MASPASALPVQEDNESDYGSDFTFEEEQIVTSLVSNATVDDDNPILNAVDHADLSGTLKLPRIQGREERSTRYEAARAAEVVTDQINKSVETSLQYTDLSKSSELRSVSAIQDSSLEPLSLTGVDARSPLERFRTPPRKSLSVTDLVSPAWCELQYWYTLSLHGRKKPTAAMKQGTKVHKILEDQVHTTVPVDIQTKEDAWGLRIWNVIQGLRTLRDSGLTRELEVWGTIDGLVINGVIDELSYTCPDVRLEQRAGPAPSRLVASRPSPNAGQQSISEFFKSTATSTTQTAASVKNREACRKVYLGDVKTRRGKTLPNAVAFRPTKMQLMLYHTLLKALAQDTVDFNAILARYTLDGQKPFSDTFISQVGNLNEKFSYEARPEPFSQINYPQSQDSFTTLLDHNNLVALWSIMISEFQRTIPHESSLGTVLKAEYRSRETGDVVGCKTFVMDSLELEHYIDHGLEWWRGKRVAQGVQVEEAYKCRTCEFADGCEWRLKKVEEAHEKSRMMRQRLPTVQ